MSKRAAAVCSILAFSLVATLGGRARGAADPKRAGHSAPEEGVSAPPPRYERAGHGGFAIELSAGGVSSGSFQGGLLAGIGATGFVFGLFIDGLQDASVPPVAPNTVTLESSSTRIGFATRVPLLRTADGRVSLFGAADLGVTNRVASTPSTSGGESFSADGWTWSVGPGLRFWLTDHLSLAYVTRFRSTHLSGAAGALPDVAAASDPGTHASADYLQLEGAFQLLCVF